MDTSENQMLFKITSAEDPLIEEHKERHEKVKETLEYSDNKDAERYFKFCYVENKYHGQYNFSLRN